MGKGEEDVLFLPKREIDLVTTRPLTSGLDYPGAAIRTTEVDADVSFQSPLQSRDICLIEDTITHSEEQLCEIGSSEVSTTGQLRERVLVRPDRVQDDVLCRVEIERLGEVCVNTEELDSFVTRLMGCGL